MENRKIENWKSLEQNTADMRIKLKRQLLSNNIGEILLISLSFSLVTVFFLYSLYPPETRLMPEGWFAEVCENWEGLVKL